MKRFRRSVIWLLVIVVILGFGLIIHEAGHAVTALIFGAKITHLQFFNIQVWPRVKWLRWDGFFGAIRYISVDNNGLVALMGSGLTAIIGLCAAVALFAVRSRGWLWSVCLTAAILLPLDIITYSLFPALGFRHWIVFGGYNREPLEGALRLGATQTAYYAGLAAYVLVCYGLVISRLRRSTGR